MKGQRLVDAMEVAGVVGHHDGFAPDRESRQQVVPGSA
jgi:hypothetical protein